MKKQRWLAYLLGMCLIIGSVAGPNLTGFAENEYPEDEYEEASLIDLNEEDLFTAENVHEENPDAHVFSEDWSFDENGHWTNMICGHSADYEPVVLPHDFLGSNEEVENSGERVCVICGYTQNEEADSEIFGVTTENLKTEIIEIGLADAFSESESSDDSSSSIAFTQSNGISNPTMDELDAAKALLEYLKKNGEISFKLLPNNPGFNTSKIVYNSSDDTIVMEAKTGMEGLYYTTEFIYYAENLQRIGDAKVRIHYSETSSKGYTYDAKPNGFFEEKYSSVSNEFVYKMEFVEGDRTIFDGAYKDRDYYSKDYNLNHSFNWMIMLINIALNSADLSSTNLYESINLTNLGWRKYGTPKPRMQSQNQGDGEGGNQSGDQDDTPVDSTIDVGDDGYSVASAVDCVFGQQYSKEWTASTNDKNCYNVITVPSQGVVTIKAKKPMTSKGEYAKLGFEVLAENGKKIVDENFNHANEVVDYYEYNVGLAPGKYYVNLLFVSSILSGRFVSNYCINFTSNSFCEIEPNNGVQTATPVMLNQKYVGWLDDEDYFSINLTQGQDVFITLDNYSELNQSSCSMYIIDNRGKKESILLTDRNFIYDQSNGVHYHRFTPEQGGTHYIELGVYHSTPIKYGITFATSINGEPVISEPNNPSHTHTYSSTWTSNGYYHWHAATCGHNETSDYSQHTYGDWVITTPATATTAGKKERLCEVCAYKFTETIPLTGSDNTAHTHLYSDDWISDSTSHWHAAICNVENSCSTSRSDIARHSFGEWMVTVPATSLTKGARSKVCKVCSYILTEAMPMTGDVDNETVILDRIDNAANGTWIMIEAKATDRIPAAAFDSLRGTSKSLEIRLPNGASWIFDGANITGSSKNIYLDVSAYMFSDYLNSSTQWVSNLVSANNSVAVAFSENGELPGKAIVRIPLTSNMISKLGTSGIDVYYVNESSKALETTAMNLNVIDGKYVEFPVWHNSTYILTRQMGENNSNYTQNGNTNTASSTSNGNGGASNLISNTIPDNIGLDMNSYPSSNGTTIPVNTDSTTIQSATNTTSPVSKTLSSEALVSQNDSNPIMDISKGGYAVSNVPKTRDIVGYYFWLVMMITGVVLLGITLVRYRKDSLAAGTIGNSNDFVSAREAKAFLDSYFR